MEGPGDLRVHFDLHALVFEELLVPLVHHPEDPVGERVLEDGRAHVGDPLLGDLPYLLTVRQVFLDLRVLVGERGDVVDGEALVLRDGDVAHLLPVDLLLHATDKIF